MYYFRGSFERYSFSKNFNAWGAHYRSRIILHDNETYFLKSLKLVVEAGVWRGCLACEKLRQETAARSPPGPGRTAHVGTGGGVPARGAPARALGLLVPEPRQRHNAARQGFPGLSRNGHRCPADRPCSLCSVATSCTQWHVASACARPVTAFHTSRGSDMLGAFCFHVRT